MSTGETKRKVCVTGATGAIGRVLVNILLKEEETVRIITRGEAINGIPGAGSIVGDLSNPDCPLDEFLDDCDILFHCAGELRKPELMKSLHVEGTSRLIQAAKDESKDSGKQIHIIQLSSCGAYGPPASGVQSDRVVTETSPISPRSEYEITKAMADELLIESCEGSGLTFSILRPSNVIGSTITNHPLLKIIQSVKSGKFFFLGKPGAISTYVHVDDVVLALLLLSKESAARGEIYNLSSDCTLEALIDEIASCLGVSSPRLRLPASLIRWPLAAISTLVEKWVHIPRLDGLVLRTRYPTNKIESELGFSFSKALPESVAELIG